MKAQRFRQLVLATQVLCSRVFAAQGDPGLPANPPPAASGTTRVVSLLSSYEFVLSCVILAFGLIVIVLQFFLLRRVVVQRSEEVMRYYTVTLIIIASLVLVAAGLSDRQIASVVGLFGTVAGYILGRAERASRENQSRETE